MDHQEALGELSVERYLLGELTGAQREAFEEHLFECPRCAAELQQGLTFLQAAREELAGEELAEEQAGRPMLASPALAAPSAASAEIPVQTKGPQRIAAQTTRRPRWQQSAAWQQSPAWLVSALAACLLFVAYQSFVVLPGVRRQLALSDSPAILNTLALSGGAVRGSDGLPRIVAPEHGSFLISVDMPEAVSAADSPAPGAGQGVNAAAPSAYSSYRCSLYSPTGALVWAGNVLPQQAKDSVQIRVPAHVTAAGVNTLAIQGVRSGDSGVSDSHGAAASETGPASRGEVTQDPSTGARLDTLARHRFLLELQK